MKRLITLISTQGKTFQEVSQELFQNVQKYLKVEKEVNQKLAGHKAPQPK